MCPSPYHFGKAISHGVQNQGGNDWGNWTPCLCAYGPKTLHSSWISPNTSRQMLRQLPDHHATTIWWHLHTSNDFMRHLLMSLRSASTDLIVVPCEFHLFLGCINQLVFHQHDGKFGHGHYSCRGWLWTPQQISHETNADGSSPVACVPTCGGNGNDQKLVWGICLDVFSDIQLLSTCLTLGEKITWHSIRLVSPTLSVYAERNLFLLVIWGRGQSLLCVCLQSRPT